MAALRLDPANGGRIASLEVDGVELLAPRQGSDWLRWGCYPMVPWAGRSTNRIAEDPGGDGWKCDGFDLHLIGSGQRLPIAGGKQFWFTLLAAMPHRPHRVDDPPSR